MSLDGLRVNHAGLDTAAEDLGRTVKQIDDRLRIGKRHMPTI